MDWERFEVRAGVAVPYFLLLLMTGVSDARSVGGGRRPGRLCLDGSAGPAGNGVRRVDRGREVLDVLQGAEVALLDLGLPDIDGV
jgi:hypothetical protein